MKDKDYYLSREIFEQLSSMTDDGFIVVNREGEVIHINQKYCDFLGTSEEEALGKSILKIIPNSMMLDIMDKKYCEECVIQTYISGTEAEKGAIVSRSYVENKYGKVIAGVAQVKFRIQTLDIAQKLMKNYIELKYYREEYVKNNKLNLSFETMVGDSNSFLRVKKLGIKASKTSFPVFLTGNTGTGKEVLAKAIHLNSDRKEHPMVSINCAAIPENLLESELFGYEEGAFTGARKGGKKGKFLIASEGTLFLDEIGDMSLGMQAKLLRVLQENEIDPIGSTCSVPINVRIIAATKKNIEKMVEIGDFREDLYYRLNVLRIELPNLNERRTDILRLADYFLNKLNVEYNTIKGFSKEVKQCLEKFNWPGNIRELDNVIKSAYAISDDLIIKLIDLPSKISFYSKEKEKKSKENFGNLTMLIDEYEKNIILNILKVSQNCKEASDRLGIHRSALYKKIKKYKIKKDF
ncbi:sigma-54 interaction domain-containing protein [Fusobacterium sp. MFO224]|uniref:sigma-54 interaction domain-containing protein n=1 Tax=Fusobacterium sp. MFO224 TaxID=3378070 RepID=UPI0038529A0A